MTFVRALIWARQGNKADEEIQGNSGADVGYIDARADSKSAAQGMIDGNPGNVFVVSGVCNIWEKKTKLSLTMFQVVTITKSILLLILLYIVVYFYRQDF